MYPFLPIYTKINSKYSKKLNVKNKLKIEEETLEKFDVGMGKLFLIME